MQGDGLGHGGDKRPFCCVAVGQVLRRLRDIKKKKGPTTPSDTGRTTLISGVEGARAPARSRARERSRERWRSVVRSFGLGDSARLAYSWG